MKRFVLAFLALISLGAQSASAVTLEDIILNGNSITDGDKTYSNFSTSGSTNVAGNGVASYPNAADITVTLSHSGNLYSITFSGFSLTGDAFGTGDIGQADLSISFDVTAAAGHQITSVGQTITGSWTDGAGHAYSDETISGYGNLHTEAGSTTSAPIAPPAQTLHIVKDVNVLAVWNEAAESNGSSSAHISVIQQSFQQTATAPEIHANALWSAISLLMGSVAVILGYRRSAVLAH
ncbi:MAG: hypothetical protein JSS02_23520 [Planctomycetes bacterium]|nr:hypothetical protein [Planctomycetota bacterium]